MSEILDGKKAKRFSLINPSTSTIHHQKTQYRVELGYERGYLFSMFNMLWI